MSKHTDIPLSGAANADGIGVGGADGSGVMFDAIAERYDRLNRLLSLGLDRGWRRRAVRAMNLSVRGHALDLATGTGDLAVEIAQTVSSATVVGVDPSAGMLGEARRKVESLELSERINLQQGSAEVLSFDDHTFDAVGIAFGVRNVSDRVAGLKEMARVTKIGGRVVVLELGEPRGILGLGARFYLHQLVPRIGGLLSGHREYRYLQKSIQAFPGAPEFADLMEECDLEMLELVPLVFGVANLYVATPRSGSS